MPYLPIRDVLLYVRVIGSGLPLLLLHGGPGVDHTTMLPLKQLADQFQLVFYDQRCNGRSQCPETSSMTFENLTADADALRQRLGFERWAVLGHSFGGMVALEYALRYPESVSHLVLVDTCGDSCWAQEHAPDELARRGFPPETVELARRFFNGQIEPREMVRATMQFGRAYYHELTPLGLAREMLAGLGMKSRPEALIFGFGQLLPGWSVMDRLGQITAPTLVLAGRHDFQFPPQHQAALAEGIRGARLHIVEDAGHNVLSEKTAEIVREVADFLQSRDPVPREGTGSSGPR